jgi:hypothetical protein
MYSGIKRDGTILYSVVILGKENMNLLYPLIRAEQDKKIEQIKMCEQEDKRLPRDDIGISIYDIIQLLDDGNMTIVHNGEKISKVNFLKLANTKKTKKTDL